MTHVSDAHGTITIENKYLTSDIAHAFYHMIEQELNDEQGAFTTEIDDEESYMLEETQSATRMTANFTGLGMENYKTNLESFFTWCAVDVRHDENGNLKKFIRSEYKPLLYTLAKRQIEIKFTYYDYKMKSKYVTYNVISIKVNKDMLFNHNDIQTDITIHEETQKLATYDILKDNQFIDAFDFATKQEMDNYGQDFMFDTKENYETWIQEQEALGHITEDKKHFINNNKAICAVNPNTQEFLPLKN